ncbi:MAG: GHKL domain-containing protein [Nitrospirae bacterium]|nr:MAG: GHKL domain-containing protein [Nitrospirota bacterium]
MKGRIGFTLDGNLRIVSWGKAISELTGLSAKNVKGNFYYQVFPRLSVNGKKDLIQESLRETRPLKIKDYPIRCLSGMQRADLSIRPLKNKRVSVTINIKKRCKYEEELQSCKRLIDLGKDASALAHGVRTPLNSIKGAVVYLKNRYPEEKPLLEFMDIIEEEINKLDSFVSRFLTGSLSPGTESKTVDLNSLIKNLEPFLLIPAETKKLSLSYTYNKIPPVRVDPFHIEQALLNLLSNAVNAVPEKGKIKVQTFTQMRGQRRYAVVEISDNGPGLKHKPSDYTSLPREGNSHGFGLFLTREIVQFYRGSLEIESQRGKGTTVRVLLPEEKD